MGKIIITYKVLVHIVESKWITKQTLYISLDLKTKQNKYSERVSESRQAHLLNGKMISTESPRMLFTPDKAQQVGLDTCKKKTAEHTL